MNAVLASGLGPVASDMIRCCVNLYLIGLSIITSFEGLCKISVYMGFPAKERQSMTRALLADTYIYQPLACLLSSLPSSISLFNSYIHPFFPHPISGSDGPHNCELFNRIR